MKKILFCILIITSFYGNVFSQQYALDALRYSFITTSGSARYMSMGGALGALGSDISCVNHNPAGVGMIRNIELSFSPGLYFGISEAEFFGNKHSEDKFNFTINNIGAVYSKQYNKTNPQKLQFLNMALSYQRTNNFNNNIFFEGEDNTFSLGQYFTDYSQGTSFIALNPFNSNLAYQTQIMDSASNGNYMNLSLSNSTNKRFNQQLLNGGSVGEISGCGAINWGNKFFAGATLGISFLNYTRTNTYTEIDAFNSSPYFNSLSFVERSKVNGLGFNVKIGAIYKPLDWLRIGFAVHSPTWYNITDEKSNELTSNLSLGQLKSTSPTTSFEYELATPLRLQASVGFIARKIAAIGVEYEWVNYGNISLRPSSAEFNAENIYIDTNFFSAHSARFGAELKLENFRIRAGYHFQSNPFKNNLLFKFPFHNISLGAGFKGIIGKNKKRTRYLCIDLAYILGITSSEVPMNYYSTNNRNAIVQTIRNSIIATISLQF